MEHLHIKTLKNSEFTGFKLKITDPQIMVNQYFLRFFFFQNRIRTLNNIYTRFQKISIAYKRFQTISTVCKRFQNNFYSTCKMLKISKNLFHIREMLCASVYTYC